MEDYARQIMNSFYIYIDTYCLRADFQRFQDMTANAVSQLYQAAEDAGADLGSIKMFSDTIHDKIKMSLDQLHVLDTQQRATRETLDQLQAAANDAAAKTSSQLNDLHSMSGA